jgi:predicted nucleic acid-binding protein
MSGDKYFVDTNVFLYLYDARHPVKQKRAEAWLSFLWNNAAGVVSWQVLQEFYSNAIRKFAAPPDVVRRYVRVLSEWNSPDMTIGLIERAWLWNDEARISFWDALIVAAAERTRCQWLLSEDFQTGREFGDTTVLNPFYETPPGP